MVFVDCIRFPLLLMGGIGYTIISIYLLFSGTHVDLVATRTGIVTNNFQKVNTGPGTMATLANWKS